MDRDSIPVAHSKHRGIVDKVNERLSVNLSHAVKLEIWVSVYIDHKFADKQYFGLPVSNRREVSDKVAYNYRLLLADTFPLVD